MGRTNGPGILLILSTRPEQKGVYEADYYIFQHLIGLFQHILR